MTAKHHLFVRLPNRKRLAVACPPIVSHDLACRLGTLVAELLAATDRDFTAAPRWAWAALDAITAAEVDPASVTVEVVRRTVAGGSKRSRTVARIQVAKPASVAA